jgi:hypothetical protein
VQVYVAFERVRALRVVSLVDDNVDERPARALLMLARGSEVHVAGDVVAPLYEDLGEDVLRSPTLVRRDQIRVPVVLGHRGLEVVEVRAAGVGFVAEHHASPLIIAHRVRPRVGQEVDVDVLRAQKEGVVAGFLDRALPVLAGGRLEGLDYLDLERFRPRTPPAFGHETPPGSPLPSKQSTRTGILTQALQQIS